MWSPELSSVRLGLSEQRLVLSRCPVWRRSAAGAVHSSHPVDQPDAWSGATAAAALALHAMPAGRAALQVVLSGQFVRWQHIAWMPALSRPDELAAYARAQFVAVYGERAQPWQVQVALQKPGHSTLACAIDLPLLQALHSTAQAHALRLRQVTPYFAAAHDHWCRRIADSSYWFAVVEPGYFTLGLVQNGQWRALRGQRYSGDVFAPLQAAVAQIGLACGADVATGAAPAPTPYRIFWAGSVPAPAAPSTLPITWLQPATRPHAAAPDWRLAWGL